MNKNVEAGDVEFEEAGLSKEEKIEQERQALLTRVAAYDLRTAKHKVAWILNHFPDTRDSDITLQLKYWTTFQTEIYSGGMIDPQDLYRLARLTTLKRARAKIQNEYKLFLASREVRQRRGTLSEEERQKAVDDKPVSSLYVVYMDDSGKQADNLIVGSVWFLAAFQPIYSSLRQLSAEFGKEFHFAKASPQDEPAYRKLVDILASRADAVSFKSISVPRRGLKGDDPFTDLYYHLLVQGIDHEHGTERAPLPRRLQCWIDSESSLIDRLRLAKLTDRLLQASSSRFGGQLIIDRMSTASSEVSPPIQVADLIAASVNRVLNRPSSKRNHKDSIADYTCERLSLNPGADPNDQVGDMVAHIAL